MSFSRPLAKLNLYKTSNAKSESYSNPGLPLTVTSIGSFMDYMVAVINPNAKPAVATEGDLPLAGNTLNDYRIVNDYNNTGQAAGYRWTQLEGQANPQWNQIQLFDSNQSILQQWALDASAMFVNENGMPGGQTIHGSTLPNEHLTLSANSGDGSSAGRDQTGYIQLFGNTRPTEDNTFDLGTATERFVDIYLASQLKDGTEAITVSQMVAAYTHAQITSGNPHSVAYSELLSRLGSLEVNGDVTTQTIDLSTGGNKAITLQVTDDSHNHTVSTITDFNDATWALLKARLVDSSEAQWTIDEPGKTLTLDITIDTNSIQNIANPAANKILAANAAGDGWEAVDGTISITGDINGSATYNSTTAQTEITAAITNTPIGTIDKLNLANLAFTSVAGNPTVITLANHGMQSGRKIRVFNSTELNGEHVITVIDANSFSIATLSSGSDSGHAIPNDSQLLYDSLSDTYQVRLENAQLSHHEISNLNADDHSQYVKKDGRGDGSTNAVTGGELDGGNLYLRSTSGAAKGHIRLEDTVAPQIGASYSGGWQGQDIGTDTRRFRDIYLAGVVKHLRVEELASLPTATAQEKGRIVQLPTGELYINKLGTSYKQLMEMPDLTGRAGKALVVRGDESGFDFEDIMTISSNSQPGERVGIGSGSVETITAPANAIGIQIQADEDNSHSLRYAWGSGAPTPTTGYELLPSDTKDLNISTDLHVIAEGGAANKLSFTWMIK